MVRKLDDILFGFSIVQQIYLKNLIEQCLVLVRIRILTLAVFLEAVNVEDNRSSLRGSNKQ